jgi:hypothetical protein
MARVFYSAERGARFLGIGPRQFRRSAEAAGCEPLIFVSASGFTVRHFWIKAAIDTVARLRRQGTRL